jgi:hypothetical protein
MLALLTCVLNPKTEMHSSVSTLNMLASFSLISVCKKAQ